MEDFIIRMLENSKNYKTLAWAFIIVILLLIIFYPVVDANYLYYNRVTSRLDILKKVDKLNKEELIKDKRLEKEYNSIVDEIAVQNDNYLYNIFVIETTTRNKLVKFISASWLLILIGIVFPFTEKAKTSKKKFKNYIMAIALILIGLIFGVIGLNIPTIINVIVNVILYQIIAFFFVYTIDIFKENEKKKVKK